jgi:hypothetical protein
VILSNKVRIRACAFAPANYQDLTMDATNQLPSLRAAGIALLATCILFMVGASVAAYFRRFPLPTDPLAQLTLIADDRIGWTAQAIIFPVCCPHWVGSWLDWP